MRDYGDLHSLLLHLPHRRLPADVAASMFVHICDGLAAVHVKLVDFGLCHLVEGKGYTERAKSLVDTRRYVAPEQINAMTVPYTNQYYQQLYSLIFRDVESKRMKRYEKDERG